MAAGEDLQAAAEVEGRSCRRSLAPSLDAYELRRLVLIGGCIATAAAANFAGSALPQRAPVAIGSALLGALLVLRRPRVNVQEGDSRPAVAEGAVEAPSLGSRRRRRARAAQADALDERLSDLLRQLEGHEQRLTSLSGRQTLIDVRARDQVADLTRRIEQLEADCKQAVEVCNRMREEQRAGLQRLTEVFVEHHQAISQLAALYGRTERHRT